MPEKDFHKAAADAVLSKTMNDPSAVLSMRGVRFQLRLLWARTGYRPTARLLHRLNLHHTRRIGPLEDGAMIHKCEWCGVSRVDHTMESIKRKMEASSRAS